MTRTVEHLTSTIAWARAMLATNKLSVWERRFLATRIEQLQDELRRIAKRSNAQ